MMNRNHSANVHIYCLRKQHGLDLEPPIQLSPALAESTLERREAEKKKQTFFSLFVS